MGFSKNLAGWPYAITPGPAWQDTARFARRRVCIVGVLKSFPFRQTKR